MHRPPHRPALAIALLLAVCTAPPAASAAQADMPVAMKMRAWTLMRTCRADAERLCADVKPGGGRVLACLAERQQELTPKCREAIPEAEELRANAAESGALPD